VLFAASICVSPPAIASTIYTVDAINDMSHWLDTGIILAPGTTYNFSVLNPGTIWNAGDPPHRDSTAAGIDPIFFAPPTITFDAFTGTFNFGALVGLDNNGFFLIGTGTTLNGLSGDLKVGYWDTTYTDNSGAQTLTIDAVPGPTVGAGTSSFALAALFLGWLARRRPHQPV
jgi:hypothetical protein